MSASEKRIFRLPAEQARYIESLVASGQYETEDEVVLAGLHALQGQNSVFDQWLREEVVPVYDAMQADPGRGVPLEQVEADLAALHAQREASDRR